MKTPEDLLMHFDQEEAELRREVHGLAVRMQDIAKLMIKASEAKDFDAYMASSLIGKFDIGLATQIERWAAHQRLALMLALSALKSD